MYVCILIHVQNYLHVLIHLLPREMKETLHRVVLKISAADETLKFENES